MRPAAQATAKEITDNYGLGIGVAGTGLSKCGPALGLACDITDRASIRRMLDHVALAYGGFDSICVTAGIFVPSDTTGHIPDEKWAHTFSINVTGRYLVADEASKPGKSRGWPPSRADHKRQRGCGQKRLACLRHLESRRESPGPRIGGGTCPARASQRCRPGNGGAGLGHVPTRSGDRFTGKYKFPIPKRRRRNRWWKN